MIRSIKSILRYFLPGGIRNHRIWSGLLKGERIVTSWHDYPAAIIGYTERPLLNWFAQNVKPGQTWLDIGAHYGYTAIALSRLVGESGRVFAFEPLPLALMRLQPSVFSLFLLRLFHCLLQPHEL